MATIVSQIPWRHHPLSFEDPFMTICTDDTSINLALQKLSTIDASIPALQEFKNSINDTHLVLVTYDKTFNLYWFHYNNATESVPDTDTGFILYQFKDFLAIPFNFLTCSKKYRLPQESFEQVYLSVYRQLISLAKSLNLPLDFDLLLAPSFVGFVRK